MKFGSLFSGIGGFDLGFERAGMECAWQCEIDPYCRMVLAKHWPDVPRYKDVRELSGAMPLDCDLLCGGFPCQDISNANTAHAGGLKGLNGERSGLWSEYERLIRELQPRWVVIENSAALSVRGIGDVLHGLAASGFDADWAVVSAGAVGAPHLRKRMFIVGRRVIRWAHEMRDCPCGCDEPWCYECSDHYWDCRHYGPDGWTDLLSDPDREGLEGDERFILAQPRDWRQHADAARPDWGDTTPRVCRGSDGIPNRVDRLRALGNAVVPQVAEWIGRRIIAAQEEER
jgi:DNA (cytosine-5)-methyltransferase 1